MKPNLLEVDTEKYDTVGEVNQTLIKRIFGKSFEYRKIIILVIFVVCAIILLSVMFGKSGGITTISESSLKEIFEIDEFSTLEYMYNSIVTVSNEKEAMYHVAYKGEVKLGFYFDELKVDADRKEKKIYITIPELKITNVYVDESSLDYIFIKDKYDTETTFPEAYGKCKDDLRTKAENNMKLKEMARENAISSIRALLSPLDVQLKDGYVIEYK